MNNPEYFKGTVATQYISFLESKICSAMYVIPLKLNRFLHVMKDIKNHFPKQFKMQTN